MNDELRGANPEDDLSVEIRDKGPGTGDKQNNPLGIACR